MRAHKQRAAKGFAEAAFLHKRAAADLAERLEAIPRAFARVLVLGSPALFAAEIPIRPLLAERLGQLVEADVAGAPIWVDHDHLPFADESFDLIVSPLFLQWANDLPGALIQLRRALRPDGLLLASVFGRETLKELSYALLAAESRLLGGGGPRVAPFVTLHQAAHLLQRTGFALPATDRDVIRVRYGELMRLLLDLRSMGETLPMTERNPYNLSRRLLAEAERVYLEFDSDADDRLYATFEIVTLTGWAPHESQQKPLKPGSAKRRLADALGTKEHKTDDKAKP